MIRRNKITAFITAGALCTSFITALPQQAMAAESEYTCFAENASGYKKGVDSEGIEWDYTLSDGGEACIYGTFYPRETMTVPAEIDGHKVVKIAKLIKETDRGQSDYGVRTKTPKSVEIAEGIREIGAYSMNCDNLNDVKIPSSVKSIGAHAFNKAFDEAHTDSNKCVVYNGILMSGENAEGNVVIPDIITCIGDNAFEFNDKITGVTIPSSVKKIGQYAFYRCPGLEKADMSEGIEVIGRNAFAECGKLKNAKIPSTVKELGFQAFDASSAVTSGDSDKSETGTSEGLVISDGVLMSGKDAKGDVVIPAGVTKIADSAFYNNQNITSVKIPDTVTEMGWIAFAGSSLKSVNIPGSIKSIPNTAFEHCVNLENVEIGDGVQTIGTTAFSMCGKLKEMNLPSSVTKIAGGAFRGCESLETFNYGENIVVEDGAFLGTKFDGVVVSRGDVNKVASGSGSTSETGSGSGTGSAATESGSSAAGTGAEGSSTTGAAVTVTPQKPTGFTAGWNKDSNGYWYYYGADGSKYTGWLFDRDYNSWFYLNQDGTMKTGWFYDNNYRSWFYLNGNGTMKTGWLYDGGAWYYLNGNGTMKTGWLYDSSYGKWYFLYNNGAMAYSTWINGYYVNSTGAWVY